ncbi:MAG TPA: hypothetical protein PK325_13430 [Cyclobacteriaceae bacterium]|nr:hypothetical protein [Cyclobacteriaceae bacterium]HMV08473.1 hypothetical protein [Cyclobacteriaceae bacterium]HMV89184.1 hypothetical protein [Cyclobacteriaceae bacterium]HMX01246.1 hypothetical protein [Cyclobacteriaceae bacterium]HMX51340.1 hypothetical protein [Cyclobacteriaceae bacterium]
MKKALLYILIAIICINSFSKQLYKVPMLIVHYTEHHALDSRVGFVDFLAMHYWDSDSSNSRDERDSQLPFKKFEHEAFSQPMTVPVSIAFALPMEPNFKSVFPDYHAPHFENAPVGSIFKPPRVA